MMIAICLIGIFVAGSIINTGIIFPFLQNVQYEKRFAWWDRDFFVSVVTGVGIAALVPIAGTIVLMFATRFAKHGFYFTPKGN